MKSLFNMQKLIMCWAYVYKSDGENNLNYSETLKNLIVYFAKSNNYPARAEQPY
jgi:hypothetical protein